MLLELLMEGIRTIEGDAVLENELSGQGFQGSNADKQRLVAYLQAEVLDAAGELGIVLESLPSDEFALRDL